MVSKKFLLSVPIIFLLACSAFAWSDWKTYKTPHFTVFYKPELEYQAWQTLQSLELYRPKIEQLTGNSKFNTSIVIEDAGILSNGFTDAVSNRIGLYVSPPSAGQLEFSQNWIANLSVHEYTHMLHLTNVRGLPRLLTSIFGNTFYINYLLPLWTIEGVAVYSESDFSPYSGRLNDGFFDAYIGANIKEKKLPSIVKATFTPFEYPLGNGPYIYGSEFLDYLAKRYGEEKFAQFFREYGKKLFVIELNEVTRKIYAKTFPELWLEWKDYEEKRFKDFAMEGERATNSGWIVKNPTVSEGKLYYAKRYPVKTGAFRAYWFSEIIEKNLGSGKERCLASSPPVIGGTFKNTVGSTLKIHENIMYYSADELKTGFSNASFQTKGYYSSIHAKSLSTGDDKILFEDEIRDFDVLPDGNIVYSKDKKTSFGSGIMLFDKPSGRIKKLFDSDYLVDRIAADDKRIIVSARRDFENFSLYEPDLKTGLFKPIIKTPFFEGLHSISEDKLFFTANYKKAHRLYAYDFSSKKTFRLTENGYADSPFYDPKSRDVYYIGLASDGFDVYKKKTKFVDFQIPTEEVEPKPLVPSLVEGPFSLKKSDVISGGYSDNLATIYPNIRLPIFYSDGSSSHAGLFLMGRDAIGDFGYGGLLLYDSVKNKIKTKLALTNNYFTPLYSQFTYSDFDDGGFDINVGYPFMTRLSHGLSSVSAGLAASSFSNFSRKQIEPYINLGFRFPNTLVGMTGGIFLERQKLGSPITRTGFFTKTALLNCFLGNEFSLLARNVYDPDNPSDVFPVIRGYTAGLADKIGAVISSNYSRPLMQVRRGAWNEIFYMEDVCGLIFYDRAFSSNASVQYSAGAELHFEIKSIINIDFGIRWAYNKEQQSSITYLLKAALPFDIDKSKNPPFNPFPSPL